MTEIYLTSTATSGDNIVLGAGDDAMIAAGVTRAANGGYGVNGSFGGHIVDVLGSVFGTSAGVLLGSSAESYVSSRVNVGQEGDVSGYSYGVRIIGSGGEVFNSGRISGSVAVHHYGGYLNLRNAGAIDGMSTGIATGCDGAKIVNTGTIFGRYYGISFNDDSSPADNERTVINYGTIHGDSLGILGGSEAPYRIENFGFIRGVWLHNGDDTVLNGGRITGALSMLGGDDTYTGIGDARVLDGIDGGDGNDTLTGGDRRDVIAGGAGNDTLRGGDGRDRVAGGAGDDRFVADGDGTADRYFGDGGRDRIDYGEVGDDVTIDLRQGTARGEVIGRDRIDGFEIVLTGNGDDVLVAADSTVRMVAGAGNDILRGSANADMLEGGAGDDRLVGNGGRDTLKGGRGDDRMTGGSGLDQFVFADRFGQDVITDFNAAKAGEKIDLRAVGAIESFADLRNNHMRQAGDDVRIETGANVLLLEDVVLGDLQAEDFLF
ncbi:calcium-binding protein [Tropicimonas marinistellae]|uniref:calcium-binding protein n=1 Tax=Tropicimonas marinistellae TaxID=1739787 RepID=UPI0008310139|nr:calcium-binding protein [Tropicimonas marinistellae]